MFLPPGQAMLLRLRHPENALVNGPGAAATLIMSLRTLISRDALVRHLRERPPPAAASLPSFRLGPLRCNGCAWWVRLH
jgi:hypothetical protein